MVGRERRMLFFLSASVLYTVRNQPTEPPRTNPIATVHRISAGCIISSSREGYRGLRISTKQLPGFRQLEQAPHPEQGHRRRRQQRGVRPEPVLERRRLLRDRAEH